jgi:phosphoglycerate kinase
LLPAYAGPRDGGGAEALEKALGEPSGRSRGGRRRQGSDKLDVLRHLVAKVDHLIIGGGMANTFLPRAASTSASRCASTTCRHGLFDPRRRRPGAMHGAPAL